MIEKKAVTVKYIQKLDDIAINKYGVPSIALMENAGKSVALETIKMLKSKKNAKVCIFCGQGNNAGDGFVAARHLANAEVNVKIFLIGKNSQLKNDAAVNCKILKKLKYPLSEIKSVNALVIEEIRKADVIVDAIFGVGLNREIKGVFRDCIDAINMNAAKILSVDISSGLDGTNGTIYGSCIKANKTVTFSFAKTGFLKNQGPKHAGKVVVVDIGIPLRING